MRIILRFTFTGGVVWHGHPANSTRSTAFEVMSKRRRGFPSETRVKRGDRVVNDKEFLLEKLGRNDLCPCGSGSRFQALLPEGSPL